MAQKDVKSRISSVKNIEKITRAMEMVAAARTPGVTPITASRRPRACQWLRHGLRPASSPDGAGGSAGRTPCDRRPR